MLILYCGVLLLPDRDNKDTAEIEMQPPVTKKAKTESTSMPSTSASTSTSSDGTTAEIKPPASSPASGVSSPLFYLTKVRGIPDYYNNPNMATGIKGTYCYTACVRGTCTTVHVSCADLPYYGDWLASFPGSSAQLFFASSKISGITTCKKKLGRRAWERG